VARDPNELRWDGKPGHYEVYYLSVTDPASGCGIWIRYTMHAPVPAAGGEATCALWFMAMDPDRGPLARKRRFPIADLRAESSPFSLHVADATLSDAGMAGAFDDVRWDLAWDPTRPAYEPVHPLLRAARVAKTVLVLPRADVAVSGSVAFPGHELQLESARGGQAHLWGSKHARRWAWTHCCDLRGADGSPRPDTFVDGVSVFVDRVRREIGPSTPVVGRFLGDDFASTSPVRVLRNPSEFDTTSWRFEATARKRRVVASVKARREDLVGVTYEDPDGERAYCYNSEVASMTLEVWDRRAGGGAGWQLRETLASDGRAHFEYGQRHPVDGLELHLAG
jgi:hypothetical protein